MDDDEKIDISYRGLEKMTGTRCDTPEYGPEAYMVTPNPCVLMVALQKRGYYGKIALARFEIWLVGDRKLSPATAKRKRRLVWGCQCDYPGEPWEKVFHGHQGDRSRGATTFNYTSEIRRALRDYAEFLMEDPESDAEEREEGRALLVHLRYKIEESEVRIALRAAESGRRKSKPKGFASPPLSQGLPALPVSTPHPLLLPAPPAQPSSPPPPPPKPEISPESLKEKVWLSYAEAAIYCCLSLGHLRNLVSADAIPVYGGPRSRKFRRDMLDLWMTDRDAAMRKFRLEREAHHGD
ncbi:MAG: helix-turn-helix domain-containing protein [Proteobacteria bacterium]|nr:helix-turn-helix domain-containing protein [Pseudomonadota bacterium]